MKIKISAVLLALWYLFCLIMIFKVPAFGIVVLITAVLEWLWKGPLTKHGITWTVKK